MENSTDSPYQNRLKIL